MNTLFRLELLFPYGVPPAITGLVCVFLAVMTFQSGVIKRENRLFTIICLLQTVNCIEVLLFTICTSGEIALKISRIDLLFYVFIIPVFIHFIFEITKYKYNHRLIKSLYLFSIILLPFTQTKYFYFDVQKYFYGFFPQGGAVFQLFGGIGLLVTIYAAFILRKNIQQTAESEQRIKLQFILYGLIAYAALIAGNILPILGVHMYPPGNFGFIPMGLMGYGLFKHPILEITQKRITKNFFPRLLTIFTWTPLAFGVILWVFERHDAFYPNLLDRIVPYAIPSVISFLICFLIATICFMQRALKTTTILFGLIATLWGFVNLDITLNMLVLDKYLALYITRIDHLFFVYQIGLSAHFIYSVIGRKQRWRFVYPSYLLGLILMPFTQTSWYFQGNKNFLWGFYGQKNFLFDVFSLASAFAVGWLTLLLYRAVRTETDPNKKKVYYYVSIGIILTAVLNMFNIPALYGLEFYPFGNFTFIPVLIMGYGIFRHNIIHLTVYSKRRILGRIVQCLVFAGFIILLPIGYWAIGDLHLNYMVNRIIPCGIPPLITALTCAFLAALALKVGHNQKEALLFSLYCLLGGVFLNTDILLNGIVVKESIGLRLSRWDHMLLVFCPALGLHLTYMILDQKNKWWPVYLSYGFALIVAPLIQTDLYIPGMHNYHWGFFAKAGPVLNICGAYGIILTTYMIYLLIRGYMQTKNVFQKNRVLFVATGFGVSQTLVLFNLLPMMGYPIYPAGNFAFISFILLGIGMFRQNLKEVLKIIKTSLFWVGLFAVFSGGAVMFKRIYPTDNPLYVYSIVLIAIIAAYQIVCRLWKMILALFLGAEKERLSEVLIALADDLSKSHSINAIYRAVVDRIFTELLSRNCAILFPPYPETEGETVYQSDESNFIGWETYNPQINLYSTNTGTHKKRGNIIEFASGHPLMEIFEERQKLTTREQIEEWMLQNRITGDLTDRIFQAELVLPIFFEEKLIALILFGEKINGTLYSQDEKVFIGQMGMLLGPYIENVTLIQTFEKNVNERTLDLKRALKGARLKGLEIAHLNQVGQLINSTLDLNIILISFEKALKEFFDFDQASIFLVNDQQNCLYLSNYLGYKTNVLQALKHYHFKLKPGVSLICDTVLKNRPIYLPDITPEMMKNLTPIDQALDKINPIRALLFCPVMIQKKIIGAIGLTKNNQPFNLSKSDINKIQRYVTQIATAINNARMAEETQKALLKATAKESEIAHLNQVVKTVNSTLDLDQVLEAVIDALNNLFHFDLVGIQMINEELNCLEVLKTILEGVSPEMMQHFLYLEIPIKENHSIFADTVLKQEPVYVPKINPEALEYMRPFDLKLHKILQGKAYLICPLEVQNKIVGTISFGDTRDFFSLSQIDIQKVQRYVSHIATAINNARLAEQTQKALQETKAKESEIAHINRVIQLVNSTLDLDDVTAAVGDALRETVPFDQMGIQLIDEKTQSLVFVKTHSNAVPQMQMDKIKNIRIPIKEKNSIFVSTVMRKKPIYLKQISSDTVSKMNAYDREIYNISPSITYLFLPMIIQKKIIGVIGFGSSKEYFELDTNDINKIQRFVNQIASAINNARLADDFKLANENLKLEITQRQKAAEALRLSEEKYRSIIDNMEDHYIEFDLAGNLVFFNRAVVASTGYSPDELMNLNYMDAFEASAKRIFNEFHNVFLTGKPKLIGLDFVAKNGDMLYAEALISLQKNPDGKTVGFQGIARDITLKRKAEMELKRAKEFAEAATKSKSEFLANMSHEIRTPMNAILGMAELLSEASLPSDLMDYVATINSSGALLLSIINDILDFSKIEAGQVDLESVDFDLMDLVENVGKILAVQAHKKGLELSCRVAPDVHNFRKGDPTRLRQVFINLLSNSIKFTDRGEVVLDVVSLDDPELLQFCIRDTGIGIPEEKQQIVFESFSQVDTTITRKYGGTGLGLAICKRLVSLMGGDIRIESEAGQGTRIFFTARLPRVESKPAFAMPSPDALEKIKILIVDDNDTNRLICRELLSAWGARVSESDSGKQAIESISQADSQGKPYHLVLLDLRMPFMDGFQVAEQINRMQLSHLPRMVMLTSSDSIEEKNRARELNIASYIVKPFRRIELLKGILPALDTNEKVNGIIQSEQKIQKTDLPPKRVLLAEDIEANRKLINLYLKKSPITLDIAENGRIAVDKFTRNIYDVVLMDLEMPEMDGISATIAIRKWEQENKKEQTPVIALTAHAFHEHRQKCFDAGCSGFLPKPIKKKDLLKTLGNLFEREK